MKKKMEAALEAMNKWATKLTITHPDWFSEEIEGFWSGTMIVDLEKAEFKKLENREMFEFIYTKNVQNGNWKERNEEEKDKISKNYQVLEVEGTILWWYALCDTEIDWKKWKILECIFSAKERWGIGKLLLEECKKNEVVYAYSKKWNFFTKNWFREVKWHLSKTWAPLYKYSKNG